MVEKFGLGCGCINEEKGLFKDVDEVDCMKAPGCRSQRPSNVGLLAEGSAQVPVDIMMAVLMALLVTVLMAVLMTLLI